MVGWGTKMSEATSPEQSDETQATSSEGVPPGETAPVVSTPATSNADYSLRIVWSLARWIEDVKGRDALEAVAAKAGVLATDFDGSTRWVSHAQLETLLAAARELAGDDATFKNALAHRFSESYGA